MTYYQKNKERITEYYKNNKEQKKEYQKEYNKTTNGIKHHRINKWKERGVIHDDFNKLYELYINTTECNVCNIDLSTTVKCLDHSHETGEFRYVLCQNCNIMDNWKKVINPPE
tara:strand:+ start:136 stop:474 length:339 start_codon:yes stop_codon:yes gene_type:complete